MIVSVASARLPRSARGPLKGFRASRSSRSGIRFTYRRLGRGIMETRPASGGRISWISRDGGARAPSEVSVGFRIAAREDAPSHSRSIAELRSTRLHYDGRAGLFFIFGGPRLRKRGLGSCDAASRLRRSRRVACRERHFQFLSKLPVPFVLGLPVLFVLGFLVLF